MQLSYFFFFYLSFSLSFILSISLFYSFSHFCFYVSFFLSCFSVSFQDSLIIYFLIATPLSNYFFCFSLSFILSISLFTYSSLSLSFIYIFLSLSLLFLCFILYDSHVFLKQEVRSGEWATPCCGHFFPFRQFFTFSFPLSSKGRRHLYTFHHLLSQHDTALRLSTSNLFNYSLVLCSFEYILFCSIPLFN